MEKITTIGLDLAKSIFQVHGVAEDGRVVIRRALRRSQLLEFFRGVEPCLVGLEACASAHHWANVIGQFGHTVRLMPPAYVIIVASGQMTAPTGRTYDCTVRRRFTQTIPCQPIRSTYEEEPKTLRFPILWDLK